jgi:hypothetical protein
MAASFALSWNRPPYWAERLHKPPGRAVSDYRSRDFDKVEATAKHINELAPQFECAVEVFTS